MPKDKRTYQQRKQNGDYEGRIITSVNLNPEQACVREALVKRYGYTTKQLLLEGMRHVIAKKGLQNDREFLPLRLSPTDET